MFGKKASEYYCVFLPNRLIMSTCRFSYGLRKFYIMLELYISSMKNMQIERLQEFIIFQCFLFHILLVS